MKLTFLSFEEMQAIDNINDPLTITEVYSCFPTLRLGIRLSDNTLVGTIVLININTICQKAEIGIHLFDKRAISFGTYKAIKKFISVIFNQLGINRLYARVQANNQKALDLDLKFGFKYEGTERQTIAVNNERKDIIMLSLLKEEWKGGD